MADEMLTSLTADITAAFVSNNHVATEEIAGLINAIHDALTGLTKPIEPAAPLYEPATTLRKSLADPAKIISMIDGKPYSMLKRHISLHGLTPATYRQRFKLPPDYPMTAPAYTEQRKMLALKIGLGRKPKSPPPDKPARAARPPKAAQPAARKTKTAQAKPSAKS